MKKALPLIVGIIMVIIGWQLWDGNEGSSLKDKEGYYEDLCKEGKKVIATLQNEYTHTKGKVIDVVTYRYDYQVNGKNFTGEVTTNKLPNSTTIEVTYLPNNPEVSERGDVCKTYESIKNNNSSPFLMYLGIGMFFIGLIIAWSGLKSLVKRK